MRRIEPYCNNEFQPVEKIKRFDRRRRKRRSDSYGMKNLKRIKMLQKNGQVTSDHDVTTGY